MKEPFQVTPAEVAALIRLRLQSLGEWDKFIEGPTRPDPVVLDRVRKDAVRLLELIEMLEMETRK
jgi:hypothetical protein